MVHEINEQNIIGLRELREHINTYIGQVAKGKRFTVVRRSKPVFTIGPTDRENGSWEPVVDFTKLRKGGLAIDDLLARL